MSKVKKFILVKAESNYVHVFWIPLCYFISLGMTLNKTAFKNVDKITFYFISDHMYQ